MSCKACGLSHSPLVRCEVARNLAVINKPESVINADVPVINAEEKKPRQVVWQELNRERYNAYQREYMRRYRQSKKEAVKPV